MFLRYTPAMDLKQFIETGGYVGLFLLIYAESGLFFGFFLPGDSVLFTAGVLAAAGYLNVWLLVAVTFVAAVLGDSTGYAFGRRVGPRIFTREESLFFSKKHLERARDFFERHGAKSVVLARFVPAGRTFVPILAGVGEMEYKRFLSFNLIGGALWGLGLPLLGYLLGNVVPDIDRYLLPIVAGIIFLSLLPGLFAFGRGYFNRES